MTYKTSFGETATVVTVAVTILFAVLIGGRYVIISDEAGTQTPVYTTTACLVIYFLAFAFWPIGYIVTNDALIIRRPVFNVRIKRTDIVSAELVDGQKVRNSFRVIGSGGLFGHYGKFSNTEMGYMTWYATRKDRTVMIKTSNGRKIILTPDDPEKFVNEFNAVPFVWSPGKCYQKNKLPVISA